MEAAKLLPSGQRRCSGQRAARTLLPAAQSTDTATQGQVTLITVIKCYDITILNITISVYISNVFFYSREKWSSGDFRDCNGESNGTPLPLSVLTK